MYALLLPVLAVVAFASMSGAAQAVEPKWEICQKHAGAGTKFSDSECEIPLTTGAYEWVLVGGAGAKVQVVTFGKLTLKTGGVTIVCKVLDGGNIWNLPAGGQDEITAFTNYECKTTAGTCAMPEIEAVKTSFPWVSKLLVGPIDEIENIKITVFCGGVKGPTYEGTLKPKIVNGTGGHPTFAEFTAGTGTLKEAGGAGIAEVLGHDYILTEEGEEVRAK